MQRAWAQPACRSRGPRQGSTQRSPTSRCPPSSPGDLLFYKNLDGDGIIDHVVMYVGSGPYGSTTIIQAPYTGTTVSYSPIYDTDLIGAGRP